MNWTRLRAWPSNLAAGAVLGVLAFVAARMLGFFHVVQLGGYEAFLPFVIVSALLHMTPLRPLVWGVAALLAIIVCVVAYTPVIVRPARALIVADSARPVQAVVVLSAGINDDARISPDGVDRLLSGIALTRDPRLTSGGRLPLVMTVITRRGNPPRTSAADQRRIVGALAEGLEVHVTDTLRRTRDEARAVAAIARRQGWERVAVVTSPLHTRRACRAFERIGVDVVCVPSEARDFAVHAMRRPEDRLRAFRLWLYETVGSLYYRVRDWI